MTIPKFRAWSEEGKVMYKSQVTDSAIPNDSKKT